MCLSQRNATMMKAMHILYPMFENTQPEGAFVFEPDELFSAEHSFNFSSSDSNLFKILKDALIPNLLEKHKNLLHPLFLVKGSLAVSIAA